MTTPADNVRLEGALNFRDLGGLPARGGKTTVYGAVYRSDALEHLHEADIAALRDVARIGCVIDLRAAIENGRTSHAWAGGVDLVSLPLSDDFDDHGALDEEGRRTLLTRKYIGYLDAAGANVVEALRLLAANAGERPTLIHCAVGKDRTGTVVALLLSLLGVERGAIVADYRRSAGPMERLLERLAANEVYRERVRTNPPEVYLAEEHTIAGFLDALDERFGGAEAWALSRGLEATAVERLRTQLLTDERPEAA